MLVLVLGLVLASLVKTTLYCGGDTTLICHELLAALIKILGSLSTNDGNENMATATRTSQICIFSRQKQ